MRPRSHAYGLLTFFSAVLRCASARAIMSAMIAGFHTMRWCAQGSVQLLLSAVTVQLG